jgi:hypothetical protein
MALSLLPLAGSQRGSLIADLKDRLFRVFAGIGEIAGIGQFPKNLKRLGPGRILSLIKMLVLLETVSATAPCPSS